MELSLAELENRRRNFCNKMDVTFPDWDTALILSKVNQYYFTGTIQNALLLFKRDRAYGYHVRQSLSRAQAESPLSNLYAMKSYRDVTEKEGSNLGNVYLETELTPYAVVVRLQNSFNIKKISSLDNMMRWLRSVKSPYELYWMEVCGQHSHHFFNEVLPSLIHEGMHEAHLHAAVQRHMVLHGHQGLLRFHDYQSEFPIGQVAFGTNMLHAANFVGTAGCKGMSAAAPVGGSRERVLQKGDLVLIDLGFAMEGYHIDKSQVYICRDKPSAELTNAHQACLDISACIVEQLRPGAIPSEIYNNIIFSLPSRLSKDFMKFADQRVTFLGHGTGLTLDELPVIAKGFDQPLEENMTLAVEPKMGVPGLGVVGAEDTYVVTPHGGRCLTGGNREIVMVG